MSKKQTKKTPSKKTQAKAKGAGARGAAKKPAAAKRARTKSAAGTNAASAAGRSAGGSASRLPPPGTVIQKRDRYGAVRCECAVEEAGIRYDGKLYRSLSGAAMAAATDLGLKNKTQNGFTFWGLTKPNQAKDPLAALDAAWERYQDRAASLVNTGITDENRTQVAAAIRKHAQKIESLRDQVAG